MKPTGGVASMSKVASFRLVGLASSAIPGPARHKPITTKAASGQCFGLVITFLVSQIREKKKSKRAQESIASTALRY